MKNLFLIFFSIFSISIILIYYLFFVAHTVTPYSATYSSLLPVQISLDQKFRELSLQKNLSRRSSVGRLESMKILKTNGHSANMLCPPIKPKIKFYEEMTNDEKNSMDRLGVGGMSM